MLSHEELVKKALLDPNVRKEYDKLKPKYERLSEAIKKKEKEKRKRR